MIFLFQYKPATCEDKADNGDIVSVHYTVCTCILSASQLKEGSIEIPMRRMFSNAYIFEGKVWTKKTGEYWEGGGRGRLGE